MNNFNGRHLVEHESIDIVIFELIKDVSCAFQNLFRQTTCKWSQKDALSLHFDLPSGYVLVNSYLGLCISRIPPIFDQFADLFTGFCETGFVSSQFVKIGETENILQRFDYGWVTSTNFATAKTF